MNHCFKAKLLFDYHSLLHILHTCFEKFSDLCSQTAILPHSLMMRKFHCGTGPWGHRLINSIHTTELWVLLIQSAGREVSRALIHIIKSVFYHCLCLYICVCLCMAEFMSVLVCMLDLSRKVAEWFETLLFHFWDSGAHPIQADRMSLLFIWL